MSAPTSDGQVMDFTAPGATLDDPLVYYVNGIQTSGEQHAEIAELISQITQHVVHGVYNATNTFAVDIGQCAIDWVEDSGYKTAELAAVGVRLGSTALRDLVRKWRGLGPAQPAAVAESIRDTIPHPVRVSMVENQFRLTNRATASLFAELSRNQGKRVFIIAHSQGNLVTVNALWGLALAYGESALAGVEVFSMASPVPVWPLRLRHHHKVYAYEDDLVTLADPHNWRQLTTRIFGGMFGPSAGDWRVYGPHKAPFEPHDVKGYVTKFLAAGNKLRGHLDLPPLPTPSLQPAGAN